MLIIFKSWMISLFLYDIGVIYKEEHEKRRNENKENKEKNKKES